MNWNFETILCVIVLGRQMSPGLQLRRGGGRGQKPTLAATLPPVKFSELLFILLYVVYVCPQMLLCPP